MLLCPWASSGKNTGMGWHALLQGIFPTQGLKLYVLQLLHCRQILYHWATSEAPKSDFQFSSVTQSCLILCDPMNRSIPGLPVHHQLPEFTQTHVHRVGDAIQPSHPLLSPSPPAFNLSQHQGLYQWVTSGGQSIGASVSASVLSVNIQDWFSLGLTGLISLMSK